MTNKEVRQDQIKSLVSSIEKHLKEAESAEAVKRLLISQKISVDHAVKSGDGVTTTAIFDLSIGPREVDIQLEIVFVQDSYQSHRFLEE